MLFSLGCWYNDLWWASRRLALDKALWAFVGMVLMPWIPAFSLCLHIVVVSFAGVQVLLFPGDFFGFADF